MTNSYTINFAATNDNLENYYVTFVTDSGTPVPFNATLNGNPLSDFSSFTPTVDDVVEIFSIAWLGDMYVSTLAFNDNPPLFTSDTTNSFQCLEFSGPSTFTKVDVTYMNWYSIPIQIGNTTTGTNYGVPSVNFTQAGILNQLESLTNSPATTVINDANGNFLRIIGPNANVPYIGTYPSFKKYLKYVFEKGENNYNTFIRLENLYDGVQNPTHVWKMRQTYDNLDSTYNTYWVSYDTKTSVFEIKGNTTFIDPDNDQPTGATSTYTIQANYTPDQMNTNIYLSQFAYTWSMVYTDPQGNNHNYAKLAADIADNDVFAAIVRDFLVGFNCGFVLSEIKDELTGKFYGADSSQEWQNCDGSTLFYDLQNNAVPNPPPYYYNSWANVIYQNFSNVYSFAFSDFIPAINPQLLVNSGDNLLVTILN